MVLFPVSINADEGTVETLYTLIGTLSEKFMAKGHTFGTAESCTGGLVAACCTDVSGSSAWFRGSIVAYANEVKIARLGVALEDIEIYGAVSREVVEAMATGALEALGVTLAIAISGVAGPQGGTPEKPVGTVWVAVAVAETAGVFVQSRHFVLGGNRTQVRFAAAAEALLLADTMF